MVPQLWCPPGFSPALPLTPRVATGTSLSPGSTPLFLIPGARTALCSGGRSQVGGPGQSWGHMGCGPGSEPRSAAALCSRPLSPTGFDSLHLPYQGFPASSPLEPELFLLALASSAAPTAFMVPCFSWELICSAVCGGPQWHGRTACPSPPPALGGFASRTGLAAARAVLLLVPSRDRSMPAVLSDLGNQPLPGPGLKS